MSSSSVCQGLQSCLEPRVIEPRVLRLKLAPPGPGSKFSPPPPQPPSEEKESSAGWSFLEALGTDNKKTTENNDHVYVHPTVKRSSSMLSEKSLEMCTESLGSETGSNASESSDDISFDTTTLIILDHHHTVDSTVNNMNLGGVSRRVNNNKGSSSSNNFPPPLKSITDFGGVHVRPHREGGRLILEAVASPSPTPYFHAERENGRLRLHLFEDVYDSEDEEEEEEEEGDEEEKEGCEEDEEEELEEIGVTKFARPSSRCKESGNRDIFGDGYFKRPSVLSLCL